MTADWNTTDTCNVAGALAEQARRQPDVIALHVPVALRRGRLDYRACDYRELDRLSDAYAHGLTRRGIGQGVRAALMVPPGLPFFALFFALFKAGAVPVLIDPGIGLKPLKECLAQAQPEAFIGVTRAHAARCLLRWAPASIRHKVTVGPRLFWGGAGLAQLERDGAADGPMLAATRPNDMAAILFTSGSTGIPKGVVYRHRHFTAQVEMLRNAFDIQPGEVDLPTFPPFALFDPALGMTTVVPWMDPTRPARARPELLVQAIERHGVTNVFGSPALLNVLSRHTRDRGVKLPTVRRVISAGAAVPTSVIRRLEPALPEGVSVHTPYGATECLPVASLSGRDISAEMEDATAAGGGICVGRPVPPNRVGLIPVTDEAWPELSEDDFLPAGATGEIVVHGPTTTDSYWRRDDQTRLAKSRDAEGRIWHRMGDIGTIDEAGRIWYAGRKSQRVTTAAGTLYADRVEAMFNELPGVERTALVGVGDPGAQRPVLCVEAAQGSGDPALVRREVLQHAARFPHTRGLETVLFHPGFPVDIRHNAKIGREALACWAAEQLA